MADEFTWEEAMELDGECCEADDGQCSGPVDLRPGIRLTNVWFFLCEHHWEQRLAGANWDGVHEQQRHLDAVPLDPREGDGMTGANWIATRPGTPAEDEQALALHRVVEQAARENRVNLDRPFPDRRRRVRKLRRRVLRHRLATILRPRRRTGPTRRPRTRRPRARTARRTSASRAGPDPPGEPGPQPLERRAA